MSLQYNINQLKLFIPKYKGRFASYPTGFYRGECVSLVKRWLQFNNWPMLRGNAIDWIKNGDGKNYRFYTNTPAFIPTPGDMAIFYAGKYGHIGIVQSADKKRMNVFNQNWPKGNRTNPAQITVFDYVRPSCAGFLRKL